MGSLAANPHLLPVLWPPAFLETLTENLRELRSHFSLNDDQQALERSFVSVDCCGPYSPGVALSGSGKAHASTILPFQLLKPVFSKEEVVGEEENPLRSAETEKQPINQPNQNNCPDKL